MNRTGAMAWMISAWAVTLRQSQVKTLAALVHAALYTQRISLANLGRRMTGPTLVKHRIKRVWRFVRNDRIEPSLAMHAVLPRLLRRYPRKKALLVSLDWTDIRSIQTLVAAANLNGRAIPLCWASCRKQVYDGHRSRNAFELSLLLMLKHTLPADIRPIILANRGLGRTELGRFCQQQGFDDVILIPGKVVVRFGGQKVLLNRYPVGKGRSALLTDVLYHQHDPVRPHVVIRWKKGLVPHRDEPWYLMTNLSPDQRWTARQRYRPSAWSSNTRTDSLSDFAIGQLMVHSIGINDRVIHQLVNSLTRQTPKWG